MIDANPFPVSHFPPPMSAGHPLAGQPFSSTGDNERRRITRHYYQEGDPTEIQEMMKFGQEHGMNPNPYVYAAANIYQVPLPEIVVGVPSMYQYGMPDKRLWMADHSFGLTAGIGIACVIFVLMFMLSKNKTR